uniref:Uncharacterized protein n=1 Tax=Caudovirales sp. ctaix4 TaxID=2827635 RepID=A0A8S5S5K4_9CAUD|nr:MAG TPA: hypothetical protein [Caudovirales sp. ctaix4]
MISNPITINGGKDTCDRWSSLAVTLTTALMLARSTVTATTVLGIRTGTTSVAHFVNLSHYWHFSKY